MLKPNRKLHKSPWLSPKDLPDRILKMPDEVPINHHLKALQHYSYYSFFYSRKSLVSKTVLTFLFILILRQALQPGELQDVKLREQVNHKYKES